MIDRSLQGTSQGGTNKCYSLQIITILHHKTKIKSPLTFQMEKSTQQKQSKKKQVIMPMCV